MPLQLSKDSLHNLGMGLLVFWAHTGRGLNLCLFWAQLARGPIFGIFLSCASQLNTGCQNLARVGYGPIKMGRIQSADRTVTQVTLLDPQ